MATIAAEQQIREPANAIAGQAEAIANGSVIGPRYAAVKRYRTPSTH